VRITRLKEKRVRPREPRRRGEPESAPTGSAAAASLPHDNDDAAAHKDAGRPSGSSATARNR